MYYPDLSEFKYFELPSIQHALNVGWLDSQHPFPTGRIEPRFLEKLRKVCARPFVTFCGVHFCEFCDDPAKAITIETDEGERPLGTAISLVTAPDGTTFVVPDLIYHYVKDHNYLPPIEFLGALGQMAIATD